MQDNPLDQPGAIPTTPRRSLRRPLLWGGLGGIVAVGLLIALAVQLLAGRAWLPGAAATPRAPATPTAMPTPQPLAAVAPTTPIAGKPVIWQARAVPANLIAAIYGPPESNGGYPRASDTLTFAPTDSHTGYLCAHVTSSATLTIWATHDGAATWTHVSDLPFVPQPTGGASLSAIRPPCAITIDATTPLRLDVFSAWAPTSYLSDDGGATWRPLGPDMHLADLSAHGAVSVAIQLQQGESTPLHLIASDDDWRTWRAIDHQLLIQGMSPAHIWQRPGDGALLVEMRAPDPAEPPDAGAYVYALWESVDAGAHWTRFPLPPNLLDTTPALVAQPYGNTPWQVCGVSAGGRDVTSPHAFLGCTRDGGQTWTARPLPIVPFQATRNSTYYVTPYNLQNARLLNDGALVSPFAVVGGTDTADLDLFILTPGTSIWKDLGPAPGGHVVELPHRPPLGAFLYDTQPKPLWVVPGPLTSGDVLPSARTGTGEPVTLSFATLP